MTEGLRVGRKALAIGVVLATLLWAMMATFLVAPLKADAAGCTSGSLIKGPELTAVYYCGADGKRYVFTNDKSYFTWYKDFSGVMTLSADQIAQVPIGGNVTYRPGLRMVKIVSDPKTYAVAAGGVLRPILDEATASCLYGPSWNTMIDDIADSFFVNYTVGTAITACPGDYSAADAKAMSACVNKDKGLTPGCAPSAFPITGAPGGPLAVMSTSPASGAASAAVGTNITVTLSAPMDPSSVTNMTFMVSDGIVTLPGTLSVDGNLVKFMPAEVLRGLTAYTVTLTTGAKDNNGRSLPSNSTWSFTTGPTPGIHAPTVTAVTPNDGSLNVAVGTSILATFSQPMDSTTITTSTFKLMQGSVPVAGTVSYTDDTAMFNPTASLSANTLYTAVVSGGAMDMHGTALSGGAFTWSFTTAP